MSKTMVGFSGDGGDSINRQISRMMMKLIHAGIAYERIHDILWQETGATKAEILQRLSDLLPPD
jgi:hypothetical protein